jgi:hypothetical protein
VLLSLGIIHNNLRIRLFAIHPLHNNLRRNNFSVFSFRFSCFGYAGGLGTTPAIIPGLFFHPVPLTDALSKTDLGVKRET